MRHPAAPAPSHTKSARAALVAILVLIASVAPFPAWAESAQPALTRFQPETYLSHIPETNPYRPVLHSLLAASPETQSALEAYFPVEKHSVSSGTLTPDQQAFALELAASLVHAATAPAVGSGDWPLQPDPKAPEELFSGILPEIGPLKRLSAIALKSADALPADQAIPIYAAVAQMSRQQRQGLFLIQQLVGSRMEDDAIAAASRRLGELDPTALRALAQAWGGLMPIPDPRRALENERDVGFTYIVESILRPALRELLGENPPEQDADTTTSFTRDLRLSGLIDHGDGELAVCLENTATKETFSVSSRHPAHDIRLERIDFERREAIIRRGRRQALIQLEAKTITEIGFAPAPAAVKSLDGILGLFRDKPDAEKRRAEWLAKVRAHPGGIEGYLSDLFAANDAYYERAFASARSVKASSSPPPRPPDDPVLNAITPTVRNFLRGQEGARLHAAMFQAAIRHRLNESGGAAAPIPSDPWSENKEPFAREVLPGGAIRLRSRYDTRDGQPVSFEFGAVPSPASAPAANPAAPAP